MHCYMVGKKYMQKDFTKRGLVVRTTGGGGSAVHQFFPFFNRHNTHARAHVYVYIYIYLSLSPVEGGNKRHICIWILNSCKVLCQMQRFREIHCSL
jgi:hypothetical protein